MVVRNASSGPNITAGRVRIASVDVALPRRPPSAAFGDIERWGGGICPEPRDVGEPFDSDPVRLNRHPLRCLDMYGMKSLLSAFDVKAHRIDPRVGAGQHIGNHPPVSRA